MPQKAVCGYSGCNLQDQFEQEHAGRKGQNQDEGEEGRRLHLARERQPDSGIGIPPRNLTLQEIQGGPTAQSLGGVALVRINARKSRRRGAVQCIRELSIPNQRIGQGRMSDRGQIQEHREAAQRGNGQDASLLKASE